MRWCSEASGSSADQSEPGVAVWSQTAALAICNFAIFFPLLAVAVSVAWRRGCGGRRLAAVVVAGLSFVVSARRPRSIEVVVGCAAAIGVALMVVRPGAGIDPLGLLTAGAATVSFAVGVVLTKRFCEPTDRVASTGWQLLMGSVVLVPLSLLVEGPPPILTTRNVAGFAYLSLVTTALAFVVWFNGIRRLPTAAPPLLGLAAPVTGVALGWIVLDQSLYPPNSSVSR